MATTKKPAAKKSSKKSTSKKYELSYGEKYLVWFAITVLTAYLIYLAFSYFA